MRLYEIWIHIYHIVSIQLLISTYTLTYASFVLWCDVFNYKLMVYGNVLECIDENEIISLEV